VVICYVGALGLYPVADDCGDGIRDGDRTFTLVFVLKRRLCLWTMLEVQIPLIGEIVSYIECVGRPRRIPVCHMISHVTCGSDAYSYLRRCAKYLLGGIRVDMRSLLILPRLEGW